jgi:8-oxo-dGTP pyrophosphatase MutT (NUDIX family)
MTKVEFLQSFLMSPLSISPQQQLLLAEPQNLKQSAVLIALFEKNNQLQVLLTIRATHLKHHAGQVSFPGGKVEQNDSSHIDTALREAQEEIGLSPEICQVVGQLHPYQTISGYSITPVIAFINELPDLLIDENEVAEIFHIPLQHIFNTNKHYAVQVQQKTGNQKVHFMPYGPYNIWGATAAILNDLRQHIAFSPH